MVNAIEKALPPPIRLRFKTLIATALGLFLALRYNDFIRSVLQRWLPQVNGLLLEFVFLVVLTILVVYLITWIEKLLDGK